MSYSGCMLAFIKRHALVESYNKTCTIFLFRHFFITKVSFGIIASRLAQVLEDLHLDAIRTITEAVRDINHRRFNTESGLLTLSKRRRRHKFILYRKIINGDASSFFESLFPSLVSDINPYHKHRQLDRLLNPILLNPILQKTTTHTHTQKTTKTHTHTKKTTITKKEKKELYKSSLLPSTTILWNNLPENIQCSTPVSKTNRHLKEITI